MKHSTTQVAAVVAEAAGVAVVDNEDGVQWRRWGGLQCPPHQCVDDLGSHTCGWSAQGFLPYSKYDVNGLILYGRYQGPLATGHRLVGLRPATLSEK